jgi:hypothetical protein
MSLPSNVMLHTSAGAVEISGADGQPAFLLRDPLHHIASADDLSSYMDEEATPDGASPMLRSRISAVPSGVTRSIFHVRGAKIGGSAEITTSMSFRTAALVLTRRSSAMIGTLF